MADRAFVDTNILLYAHDTAAGRKHEMALKLIASLWQEDRGSLSLQVLQEFSSVLLNKFKIPLKTVKDWIKPYEQWMISGFGFPSLMAALELKERYGFSFWDSLIFQAAFEAEAKTLYSEDFSHGQKIRTLQVINPFKE